MRSRSQRSGSDASRLARKLGSLCLVAALGCGEDGESPSVPSEPPAALVTAASQPLAFYQVSGGNDHTCGVTTGKRVYCWGSGWLGNGVVYSQRVPPVAVMGATQFLHVSVGYDQTCAVTLDYHAYCWGRNNFGQLGDGTTTDRVRPVLVRGNRQFRQIDAGYGHTCGVGYLDKRVYCWGANSSGALGDGTTVQRLSPVTVSGGRQYRQLSAGWSHTCAVITASEVFCWGSNQYGQIGDGSTVKQRVVPTRISSTLLFRQLDAGANHTCAVTTDSRAICWGDGGFGQVGDGKTYLRFTPKAVVGGLHFDRVTAGYSHSCGEGRDNRAYCWGNNVHGELGDGTTTQRLTPVAVVRGLSFAQLSAGSFHTCGVTPAAAAFCWGSNWYAQLGDGTITDRTTPTAVAGPM